jgi:hypothetical protein
MNDVVELRLTAQQADSFREVLDEQTINGGFIFAFVSRSFEPSEGKSVVRFQCKRVSKKTAASVARVIREDKS